jgi:hypothetical protein
VWDGAALEGVEADTCSYVTTTRERGVDVLHGEMKWHFGGLAV